MADELENDMELLKTIGVVSVNNPNETAEEYYERMTSGVSIPEISVNSASMSLMDSLALPIK